MQNDWKIPLFKTHYDDSDTDAVSKVIRRGTYWADGPEIKEFEKKLADYIGREYALAFNSGTSALHALLLAYDINGYEVIVPSFTFISTVNSVVLAGGIPVFAELESDTLGLDAEDVKKKISEKTKAVILVHYAGCPAKHTLHIKSICEEKGVLFIEDNAEAMGASIKGKKTGAFGHSAMLSFCQSKIITTGEGGAIVTDSKELYEKMKLIRSHGRLETEGKEDYFSSTEDNDYITLGYNYRLPTISGALGLSQIKKIDKLIASRKRIAEIMNEKIGKLKEVKCPIPETGFEHVYQMYTILLDTAERRDSLQDFLIKRGIMTKIYFNPAHLKTFYTKNYGCDKGNLPITEQLSKKVLTLPMYVDMSEQDMAYIAHSINDFFEGEYT